MNVMTGSEKKCRYGLAWKTNNAGIYKNINLKRARNKCVLLTDKSGKVQNDLSNMLKKYNDEVVITHDEENALKTFRKKRYDLLISIIPGIAGVDFLGKIKTLAPEMEVLIVSGLELLESCLETIISEAFVYQNELNKTQILAKKDIKDFYKMNFAFWRQWPII